MCCDQVRAQRSNDDWTAPTALVEDPMTLGVWPLAANALTGLCSGKEGQMGAAALEQAVRKGRKFDQVLIGARKVFLRDGFERASVDDIAREAGVSKATIYAYFPDKQLLFLEVASMECRRQVEDVEASMTADTPVRTMLTDAGERIAAVMMSESSRQVFRIVIGEAEHFPGLAQEMYQFGPGVVLARLARGLQCYVDTGELSVPDVDLAAQQFVQLSRAPIHDRIVFGMAHSIKPEEVRLGIDSAVEMFMARYGVKIP
jgi:TetR/AcrR family transcriptional regulator, mexJK operon transcriptional repressor